jgi:xylitol oxidase
MSPVNWAGNYVYRAKRLHRASSMDQLRQIVATSPSLRVIGSRHSFTDIGDATELVTLEDLPTHVEVDHEAQTVDFSAWLTYGELAKALAAQKLALHNLASLPHISVAGAIATATHGSGDGNGNLATAVAALELVTSSGDVITAARGDADFEGLVVGLGALGVLTRLTLDVEPYYEVRQRVFEGLGWEALLENFDDITAAGDSVSVFTRWGDTTDQVWVKSRVTDAPEQPLGELFGATPATVDRHPILGIDPVNCSPQLGRSGPWWDRLPHFRMGFTPSSGEELQSEFFVARHHAAAAIDAMRGLAADIAPLLLVSEIRTIAADRLWLSPHYGRDTVGIHLTWKPEQEAVERVLSGIEAALAPLEARPHWGKLFRAEAAAIGPLYERLPDFDGLQERLDPRGAFRNEWLRRRVLGGR